MKIFNLFAVCLTLIAYLLATPHVVLAQSEGGDDLAIEKWGIVPEADQPTYEVQEDDKYNIFDAIKNIVESFIRRIIDILRQFFLNIGRSVSFVLKVPFLSIRGLVEYTIEYIFYPSERLFSDMLYHAAQLHNQKFFNYHENDLRMFTEGPIYIGVKAVSMLIIIVGVLLRIINIFMSLRTVNQVDEVGPNIVFVLLAVGLVANNNDIQIVKSFAEYINRAFSETCARYQNFCVSADSLMEMLMPSALYSDGVINYAISICGAALYLVSVELVYFGLYFMMIAAFLLAPIVSASIALPNDHRSYLSFFGILISAAAVKIGVLLVTQIASELYTFIPLDSYIIKFTFAVALSSIMIGLSIDGISRALRSMSSILTKSVYLLNKNIETIGAMTSSYYRTPQMPAARMSNGQSMLQQSLKSSVVSGAIDFGSRIASNAVADAVMENHGDATFKQARNDLGELTSAASHIGVAIAARDGSLAYQGLSKIVKNKFAADSESDDQDDANPSG
jgi:hypothetical protein